ncbi:MAG: histidinol phosphate phosphatase [Clostridium sp.]
MLFDCHMHSEFSSDSEMKLSNAIEKAKDLKIGIILTEHTDFNYPDPNLFRLNATEYFKAYSKFRNNSLLLGVEIGLSQTIHDQNSNLINSFDFDFVIGSMHSIFDKDIYKVFRENPIPKNEFYKLYFKDTYECIKNFDNFDSLGHIDYPCRYLPFEDKEIHYEDFRTEIDDILNLLISKNKVLELNSARLGVQASYDALLKIYSRYHELGGKYVTLGSDAHTPLQIGRNFDKALIFLKEANLKPIYFKNRKPILI